MIEDLMSKKEYSKEDIKEIEELLFQARERYYDSDLESELTDYQYDYLEDKLKELDPKNKLFSFVGNKKGEIKHDKKMLSLQKTYDKKDLVKWIGENRSVAIQKIDGVSCSLIFDNKLILAKTRGDGSFGKDITDKVKYLNLPKGYVGEIRGEIYCSKENFLLLQKEMKKRELPVPSNERNIVSGLVSRKTDKDLCKYLSFFAFDILEEIDEILKFEKLKELGFEVPEYSEDILAFVERNLETIDSYNYLIDGIVVSYNDVKDKKGYTSHHPKYKMAFKWNREEAISVIENISWQISRNGIFTPVANIKEVQLSGAKISNVTLHNLKTVRDYNLKIGDEIRIIRSGEVIPKFIGVKKSNSGSFKYPQECPSCSSSLKEDDVRLKCINEDCDEIKFKRIEHFAKCLGIDDLSEKRLRMMSDFVQKEIDLFSIKREDLLSLDFFQEKLTDKILNNINDSKNIDILSFLKSLGFEGGSSHVTKLLIENDLVSSVEDLLSLKKIKIKGVGETKENLYLESLRKNKNLINQLIEIGFKISFPKNSLNFVITGKMETSRKELEKLIISRGHVLLSSVSSKANYLVANSISNSSKFKKAKELKINIISEKELLGMLSE